MRLFEFFQTHPWCKGAFARTANGRVVSPDDPEARAFCLVGGLAKVYGNNTPEYVAAYERLYAVVRTPVIFFNDMRTTARDNVLDVIQAAAV